MRKDRPIDRVYTDVLVYLHGFPDMAVHPAKLDFSSRLPFKLAEAWMNEQAGRSDKSQRLAFVTFNFSGVPGSDDQFSFRNKTISHELDDAVAAVADTIAVIAGLVDLKRGMTFDFNEQQRHQFDTKGWCWKEFYLPDECPMPQHIQELSLDGESAHALPSSPDGVPRKIFLQLDQQYVQECYSDAVDIGKTVAARGGGDSAPSLVPFLIIHGEDDQNVPFANGQELFAAADKPKQFLAIPKANHLLSNSKHLKKAIKAVLEHIQQAEASRA
ncbi:TPA: hypothetical protein N0F65_010810 [Lagenidium giganteum]|uniref:Peptidase S9 prolyl oligopeptidase catalytic domain-containing protein n=1 Tax=Lagenidium giganteum TaxID=4803 RepID=A0AAV2YKX1_9STRA|nr:TPA: hypothetical protein N0F65_010810 [Lagenidium giganteum]